MTIQTSTASFGIHNAMKRYSMMYHAGERNHCPGCGHTQWHVGRTTAECASCGTALALAYVASMPTRPLFYVRNSKTAMAA